METTIDRELVAAKLDQLVGMVQEGPASMPVRLGFLLGELQGLAISIRHGGSGNGDPSTRAHLLAEEVR